MAKNNTITDEYFMAEYFNKFVDRMRSNAEYQRMESVANSKGFQIRHYHLKIAGKLRQQFNIGFEVCDAEGETISVPKTSRFYDDLGNLCSDYAVVVYHKISKKIDVLELDEEELNEDCNLFSAFLQDEYLGNDRT